MEFPNSTIKSEIKHNEYVYIGLLIIGIIFVLYAIKLHFDMYDADYIPVKAHVTNVDCTRYIVNRHQDKYHCILAVTYTFNDRTINGFINTVGMNLHYSGSDVKIYVNKNDPIDITMPKVSPEMMAILFCFFGTVLIITLGARFLDL